MYSDRASLTRAVELTDAANAEVGRLRGALAGAYAAESEQAEALSVAQQEAALATAKVVQLEAALADARAELARIKEEAETAEIYAHAASAASEALAALPRFACPALPVDVWVEVLKAMSSRCARRPHLTKGACLV